MRMRERPGFVALYDAAATLVAALLLIGAALVAFSVYRPLLLDWGRVTAGVGPATRPGVGSPGVGQKLSARIRIVTMTPAVATRHKVRYRPGVLVVEVQMRTAGSGSGPAPAGELAVGLREADVIIGVNGHPVASEADLAAHLARYAGAPWVEVVVVRSGRMVPVLVSPEAFDL